MSGLATAVAAATAAAVDAVDAAVASRKHQAVEPKTCQSAAVQDRDRSERTMGPEWL